MKDEELKAALAPLARRMAAEAAKVPGTSLLDARFLGEIVAACAVAAAAFIGDPRLPHQKDGAAQPAHGSKCPRCAAPYYPNGSGLGSYALHAADCDLGRRR